MNRISINKVNLEGLIWCLFFCMIFVHYGIRQIAIFSYIIPTYFGIISILRRKKYIKITNWYFVFGIWVCISVIWVKGTVNEFSTLIETIKLMLILFGLSQWVIDRKRVDIILKGLVISSIYLGIVFLVTTPTNLYMTDYMGEKVGIHGNGVAELASCMAGISTYYFIKSLKSKISIGYIISSIFFGVLIFITGSRTAIISLILMGVLAIIFTRNIEKRLKRLILGGLIISAILYFLMLNKYFYDNYYIRIVDIFKSDTKDGSVLTRAYFRNTAMQLFWQKPIFGWGIEGFRYYLYITKYFLVTYSHCDFTEILCDYGIIGFILFYIPILKKLIQTYLYRNNSLFIKLVMLELLSFLISEYGTISYYSRLIIPILFVMFQGTNLEIMLYKKRESNER